MSSESPRKLVIQPFSITQFRKQTLYSCRKGNQLHRSFSEATQPQDLKKSGNHVMDKQNKGGEFFLNESNILKEKKRSNLNRKVETPAKTFDLSMD